MARNKAGEPFIQPPLFELDPGDLDTDTVVRRMLNSEDPAERKTMGAEYDRRRVIELLGEADRSTWLDEER